MCSRFGIITAVCFRTVACLRRENNQLVSLYHSKEQRNASNRNSLACINTHPRLPFLFTKTPSISNTYKLLYLLIAQFALQWHLQCLHCPKLSSSSSHPFASSCRGCSPITEGGSRPTPHFTAAATPPAQWVSTSASQVLLISMIN